MQVDIYADIACPWCYIGADRFERARKTFTDGDRVEVVYRPFQLDPNAPQHAEPMMQYLTRRFGAQATAMAARVIEMGRADGLVMDYARGLAVNTFNAHRLLHHALEEYGATVQRALAWRLYKAHFSDGKDVGDAEVLAALATDVAMDAQKAREFLISEKGTREVREAIDTAREAGISAVPTFVFEEKYMVEGAQSVEGFVQALEAIASGPAQFDMLR
jgi:predicted DsbA family dithiol-disulfide isomerase